MTIWVDADACPVVIKEIIFKAANRTETMAVLIANSYIRVPPSKFIQSIQVEKGFDVADNEIVRRAEPGDLVITADIPLAAEIVEKKAVALNPRGERYTTENVRQRLNMRDFMDTMRSSGIQAGGPPPLSKQDRQKFANELDRYLARNK
ncbi:MAG: YaiI/YqxD family protein [Pseudomonadales bacterium]|nr:YaiI/YqxD family protein [Pseudomonadales bacterium]